MFAKIFSSIFDSSIADDWQTRVVFQDMLVLADKDGIVDMMPTAIARRTNLPLEIVRAAIPKLEGEDKSSRTPDHDGRRIMRLDMHRDWGWRIVNYAKYRESATKEMLRMAEADRKRAYRNRHSRSPSPTPPTHKNKKQRGEADMSVDMSGTPPKLPTSERITYEKSLTRIDVELKELKDANLQWAVERRKELKIERQRLRDLLGIKA